MPTYTGEDVMKSLNATGMIDWPRIAILKLDPNETAWDPASTKREISGPALVTYFQYSDGGVAVTVKDRKIEGGTS